MNNDKYLTKSILIKLSNFSQAALVRSHIIELLSHKMEGHECYVELFDTARHEDYTYEMFIRIPTRFYNQIVLTDPSYFFGDCIEDTKIYIPRERNGAISKQPYDLSFTAVWNNE